MPEVPDNIFATPISELAPSLRSGKISPVTLTELALSRLEKYGPKFNAVVTVMRESALKEAARCEAEIKAGNYRGPLHGIPYGVKDLLATKGIPTTWGAAPYRKQVFDLDAESVVRLREAGAILCAKLAMVELAGGMGYRSADASFTGPGLCPWNPEHWSGGSSTGPGIAVAAGLVSFAIGSETSGSIITPGAYCGVTSLRPTYGRITRHGAMALCWTLDKLGPMCRSAADAALILKAVAGKDSKDASSVAKTFEGLSKSKRWKIGILKNSFDGVQDGVKKNLKAAIEVLKGFADIDENEIALPALPFGAAVGTIVNAEGAAAFRDLIESGKTSELQDEADKTGGFSMLMTPAVDYLQAMRLREKMKVAMAKMYSGYDAILSPARESVAPPIAKGAGLGWPGVGSASTTVIPAGNLVGWPAVAVPTGLGEKGLPTALQLTGPAWSEGDLLAIAAEYQKATGFHRLLPKL